VLAIVPFRDGQEGRLQGARHVVASLRRLARVVVVEQGGAGTPLGADARVHLPVDGPFNRSACFNAGVRAQPSLAPREPLLFSDCDIPARPRACATRSPPSTATTPSAPTTRSSI
jgi:hypothetical protein